MNPIAPVVLVVEDDVAFREVVACCLRKAGLRVVAVGDSAEARRMLAGTRPDLAVLDVMLPEGSGYQLLQLLRDATVPPVPVVMMSGYGSDAHQAYAGILGAEAFLVKPFPLARLLALVSAACPGWRPPNDSGRFRTVAVR